MYKNKMPITDFLELFNSIEAPTIGSSHIVTLPIPSFVRFRIGKDYFGRPVFLLPSMKNDSQRANSIIKLEYVTIEYDTECSIVDLLEGVRNVQFTIITCTSHDSIMHTYFLRIILMVVSCLGPNPKQVEILENITKVVELFRSVSQPPQKSIQGLWGEIFVISLASQAQIILEAWHRRPSDIHDFCLDAESIEVKSTSIGVRKHHFSLHQIRPVGSSRVFIASVVVISDQSGSTVEEMSSKIISNIANYPHLQLKLENGIAKVLGNNWRIATRTRFSIEQAKKSLRFYEASEIPSIEIESIPANITDVHFQVDLSAIPQLDLKRQKGKSKLLSLFAH
jgi:hypothetical protein